MKLLKKLMIVLIIGLAVYGIGIRINETSTDYIEEEYTVQNGDTLWSIAEEYADDNTNLQEYIYKIKKVNNITSNLEVGQTIKILK